jgi:Domain of unknown function (DUF4276)
VIFGRRGIFAGPSGWVGWAMSDVVVVCEGQTEREFCREVVAPHLAPRGVYLAGTLRGKPGRKRGGIASWASYRGELIRLAKERSTRHVGVLVDYYRLPPDWPGRTVAATKPVPHRGPFIETALKADLLDELGDRFVPCIEVHEFESLLFVEPETSALTIAIGAGLDDYELVAAQLAAIKSKCGGDAEAIDDSPQTAPAKRIISIVPGYDKVGWGVPAAADVSLNALRSGCRWLDRWLTSLEAIGGGHG